MRYKAHWPGSHETWATVPAELLMSSAPLGWPLNLSRPQIPLLKNGVRLLALSASQKCCMAENEIKDMKTNVSPSSTQTRMGGAAAGTAEEPEAVGGGHGRKTELCTTMVETEPGPGISSPRGWNLRSCI